MIKFLLGFLLGTLFNANIKFSIDTEKKKDKESEDE